MLKKPPEPKNKIEVKLIFAGNDDDPQVVVGKWLQERKQFAVEALTMMCQVRELIRAGYNTPHVIKLAAIESMAYLQFRLRLVEQLTNFTGDRQAEWCDDRDDDDDDKDDDDNSNNHRSRGGMTELEIEL
jgi:hypothetical protein